MKVLCAPGAWTCDAGSQNAAITAYVYDAAGQLAAEYSLSSPDTGRKFVFADGLGSTRLYVAESGSIANCYDYLPFGEEIGQGYGGRSASCYGTASYPSSASIVREKFTGKERDAETGLDYFAERYFSAAQGRWTSPDWSAKPTPIPYANLRDPQPLNLYGYVRNSPLSAVDLDGHGFFNKLWNSLANNCYCESDELEAFRQKNAETNRREREQISSGLREVVSSTVMFSWLAMEEPVRSGTNQLIESAAQGATDEGLAEAARGNATVSQYPSTPMHFSIEVNVGSGSLATEQVITNAATNATSIMVNGSTGATRTWTFDLLNPQGAMDYARGLIGTNTGKYDGATNSCLSHCGNVLNAGGIDVPVNSTRGTVKLLKSTSPDQ